MSHGDGARRFMRPHGRAAGGRTATSGLLRRWFVANSTVAGVLALAWLALRSGSRPSRLAYPCQRAALSTAALALGAPLVAAVIAARRALVSHLRSPAAVVVAVGAVLAGVGVWGALSGVGASRGPAVEGARGYGATVLHVSDCPQDPVGDRFPGLDNLLALMGSRGLKLYRSTSTSGLAGPNGIVDADDVVVIKINYQWPERGGTNTDLLRGLILALTEHPDGFTGEVVVCENAQFQSVEGFDRALNNAQDHGQSPHDVVVRFQGLGHRVSHYDWTSIKSVAVAEYSAGDDGDGYVVGAWDPALNGRVSYPKFRTSHGTRISLRDGLWDPMGGTYDRESLKVVNLPVLKSHHAVYGATACVKNTMGLVTNYLGTNSHAAVANGLLGAALAEIRPADLNILDCIWINANPFDGPWTSYAGATRRDELVASTDPVAADIWSVTNILIPGFLGNGYTPPWPHPEATPDDPTSDFRVYLDNSMSRLLLAGYPVTNDLGGITAHSWDGTASLPLFADGFDSGGAGAWSGVVE